MTDFPSPIRLSGLGLVLREWSDDDVPVMVELFDEPEIARWTPLPSPFDLVAAQDYLAKAREARAAGRRIQLAITTDGHAAQGEILLSRAEPDGEVVELAYAIGARHRRQRLAVRAVELMTSYAHDVLAMNRVLLRIRPDNTASIAVAHAAGFRQSADEPSTCLTWCHHKSNGRSRS
jgi:RimJ/RimL family protein N-acetyltransferase